MDAENTKICTHFVLPQGLWEASQDSNSLTNIPQLIWPGMTRGYVTKSRTMLTYPTCWSFIETNLASNYVYTWKVCWVGWGNHAHSQTPLNPRNKGPKVTFRSRAMPGWVLLQVLLIDSVVPTPQASPCHPPLHSLLFATDLELVLGTLPPALFTHGILPVPQTPNDGDGQSLPWPSTPHHFMPAFT